MASDPNELLAKVGAAKTDSEAAEFARRLKAGMWGRSYDAGRFYENEPDWDANPVATARYRRIMDLDPPVRVRRGWNDASQRKALILEMGDMLWAHVAPPSQRGGSIHSAPAAAKKAAGDLATLYEARNNGASLPHLQRRLQEQVPDWDDEVTAWHLVFWAVGAEEDLETAHAARVQVPKFSVEIQGDELSWDDVDGGVRTYQRNPPRGSTRGGLDILLIEPDAKYQAITTKLIKKLYPSARIWIADNAMSAIGNIDTHDYNLIVSEVELLGSQTGIDVFRHVQKMRPNLVDKFVFFTTHAAANVVHPEHVLKKSRHATQADLKEAIFGAKTSSRTTPPKQLSDLQFAQMIWHAIAQVGAAGRWGNDGHTVFISSAWDAFNRIYPEDRLTLDDFKRRLITINTARLVDLTRSDMPMVLPENLRSMSETRLPTGDWGGDVVHFVWDFRDGGATYAKRQERDGHERSTSGYRPPGRESPPPPPPPPPRRASREEEARAIFGFATDVPLTERVIKERWRKLAKENHPDLGGSTEAMAQINNAADILFAHLAR